MTRIPPGKTREDDDIDFGIVEVDDALAAKLAGCHFLTANQVERQHEARLDPPRPSKYLAIGYPLNRFRYKRRPKKVTIPRNLAFAGSAALRADYTKEGLRTSSHLLLALDPNAVVGPTGVQQGPKMIGLSGGGVFHFPAIERPGLLDLPTLVAVTTEQRKQAGLLVSTKVDLVLEAMDAVA